ncbi:KilAC domain (KilAC) [Commensalibacter communis]|nr:KilAC domain (KilAC) [Commensalibacter communis]
MFIMNNNTNHDNNSSSLINPVVHEGELRILDIDLAQRLGFERPRDIRKLISRYTNELDRMGTRATVERVINGGKAKEFYLNRKQAIFITAKSETKEATEITIEIIERFEAYERGEINQFRIPQTLSEALRLAADQAETINVLKPKADALDLIATSDGMFSPTEAAKILQIRRKDLFAYLHLNGWTFRWHGNGKWTAYSDKVKSGDLFMKVTTFDGNDGVPKTVEDLKITPKGLAKLSKIFSKESV